MLCWHSWSAGLQTWKGGQVTPWQGSSTQAPSSHDLPSGQSTPSQVFTQLPSRQYSPEFGHSTSKQTLVVHVPSRQNSPSVQRSGKPVQLSGTHRPSLGRQTCPPKQVTLSQI